MSEQSPLPPAYQPPEKPAKKPWYKRTWVLLVAVGVVAFGIGAASATAPDPTTTSEYKAQAKKLSSSRDDVTDAKASLATAMSDLAAAQTVIATKLGDIPAREAALKKGEAALATAKADLKSQSAAVKKREKAVGIVETEIEQNTIEGDSIYEVGSDIKAGKYKTQGGAGSCYYAVLGDANGDNIITNGNVSGGAFVTVRNGQYLELGVECAEWSLQR